MSLVLQRRIEGNIRMREKRERREREEMNYILRIL